MILRPTMLHSLKRSGSSTKTNDIQSKLRKFSNNMSSFKSSILNPPKKSQSDKKIYRLIKLPNGLHSLLVQHFIDEALNNDPDEALDETKHDERNVSESDASMVENDEQSDCEEEEDEEDCGQKEKMAAVALCIRVGSWYDPIKIQGLSHFLEHMASN